MPQLQFKHFGDTEINISNFITEADTVFDINWLVNTTRDLCLGLRPLPVQEYRAEVKWCDRKYSDIHHNSDYWDARLSIKEELEKLGVK